MSTSKIKGQNLKEEGKEKNISRKSCLGCKWLGILFNAR